MNYLSIVEKHQKLIIDAQEFIWKHPETAFKEKITSAYLEKAFEDLGYELVKPNDITGFYTVIDTGRKGPEVLILGELDSLICREHPEADKETGAVHCCGHCAQTAALLGVAATLKEPGILDSFSGRIRLCAVPAEELIEIDYRLGLKKEGVIKYLDGKIEFLHRGYFDGVDIAFMIHTSGGEKFNTRKGSVGCIAKKVVYKGISSHAGGAPWSGKNALYAANLGLSAINSLRETFKEDDIIRVHPIITCGGGAVNAIPDKVVIESFVRGKTYEAIERENKKINRALCGAAVSMDVNIEIIDTPICAPLLNNDDMIELFADSVKEEGFECSVSNIIGSGSTDMGDLSVIMPVIHPYAPGAVGRTHGDNYYIKDPYMACVASAAVQVRMLHNLLSDGAKRAYKIIENFKPFYRSKEDYLNFLDNLFCEGDRISYGEEKVEIKL